MSCDLLYNESYGKYNIVKVLLWHFLELNYIPKPDPSQHFKNVH